MSNWTPEELKELVRKAHEATKDLNEATNKAESLAKSIHHETRDFVQQLLQRYVKEAQGVVTRAMLESKQEVTRELTVHMEALLKRIVPPDVMLRRAEGKTLTEQALDPNSLFGQALRENTIFGPSIKAVDEKVLRKRGGRKRGG